MIDLPPPTSFVILGVTTDNGRFRPSDWADRLCGVMSSFRPRGMAADHLSYSPYVQPSIHEGTKCVRVDARIQAIEPMAYDFLRKFAADNHLCIIESDA